MRGCHAEIISHCGEWFNFDLCWVWLVWFVLVWVVVLVGWFFVVVWGFCLFCLLLFYECESTVVNTTLNKTSHSPLPFLLYSLQWLFKNSLLQITFISKKIWSWYNPFPYHFLPYLLLPSALSLITYSEVKKPQSTSVFFFIQLQFKFQRYQMTFTDFWGKKRLLLELFIHKYRVSLNSASSQAIVQHTEITWI